MTRACPDIAAAVQGVTVPRLPIGQPLAMSHFPTYRRRCRHCARWISLRQMPAGHWLAFERDSVHDCDRAPKMVIVHPSAESNVLARVSTLGAAQGTGARKRPIPRRQVVTSAKPAAIVEPVVQLEQASTVGRTVPPASFGPDFAWWEWVIILGATAYILACLFL